MKYLICVLLLFISLSTFAQNRNYTYDNLGRLTQIQYTNGSMVQYSYDANGNRLQHIISSNATNIDLAFNSMSVTPLAFGAGGSVAINAVNINTGNAVAPSQYIKVWRSSDTIINAGDLLLDSMVVSSVNANGVYNLSNWNITIPSATAAGTYYLILKTDANNIITETNETNNTKHTSITITSCPIITITETISNANCGIANGTISMSVGGGASPYQYSITNGNAYQNSNVFNNLSASSYTCKVKDANGCMSTKLVTVNSTGGNVPIPNFTYGVSGQTITLVNTSQYATSYTWDFGDGSTMSSINPTHTYASTGVYNVCLTASNTCGSNQICSSVNVNNSLSLYDGFPKMYHNSALEVGINTICKSYNNNGWIIPMSMVYNVIGGSYTNYIGKVTKVDTNGNPLWNIDFYNSSAGEILKFDSLYVVLINNNLVLINDNGQVTNTIQGNGTINDITKNGNILTWIEQYSSNNTYLQNAFRLKSINITNPGVIVKQENINLDYVAVHSAKVEAFSNGMIYFYGTYQDPNFGGNPYYTFIYKYSLSSCCGPAWQWSHNSQKAIDLDEDINGNLILSMNTIFTYNSLQSTLKINPNGTVAASSGMNGFLRSDTAGNMYFRQGNSVIKTDGNFSAPTKINFITPYFNSIAICDAEKQNNFLLCSDACPLFYGESNNIIDKLKNEFRIKSNSCMTDTVTTYTIPSASSFSSGILNLTGFYALDNINLLTSSINSGVIQDSTECYPPACLVTASFTKSKLTACLGDIVTFTSTSNNAPILLWRINGVNSGNTNSIQKTFTSTGTYTIQLIGSEYGNCPDTAEYIYTITSPLTVSSVTTNMNCGQNNGSINVNTIGGLNPFMYSVVNGGAYSNNNTFTNLASNTYTINVIDANGCSASNTATINTISNPNISIAIASNIPNCSSSCNGTAIVSASGGNSPYTYSLSPLGTQSSIGNFSNLCANTVYTITATDATGCTKSSTFNIVNSAIIPTVTASSTPANGIVCAGSSVTLSGGGATTYTWSGGVTNALSFIPTTTTTYTVTGTANGCTSTATKTIIVNTISNINLTASSPNYCNPSGTPVTITASSISSLTYTYMPNNSLTPPNGAIVNATPSATTTYTVTGTSANGCTRTSTLLITVIPCSSTFNIKLFIQGYYISLGQMAPALKNQGVGSSLTITDSITVELHSSIAPFALINAQKVILNTSGIASINFPTTGSYYIVIKHRNGLETWSAIPVTSSSGNYNFTTLPSKAYGSNMKLVETNTWALYSGDLNDDENIDLLDISPIDIDISNFNFGYYATDLNGDGNVDLLDLPIVQENVNDFIFSIHP